MNYFRLISFVIPFLFGILPAPGLFTEYIFADQPNISSSHIIKVISGDGTVIIRWNNRSDASDDTYTLFRKEEGQEEFIGVATVPAGIYNYVDHGVVNGRSYEYILLPSSAGSEYSFGESSGKKHEYDAFVAFPSDMTDEEFLDFLQHATVDFFWFEANPSNGLIKDRNTDWSPSSIASIGFGITAICIGIDRGWILHLDGRNRILTTLRTLWQKPQGRDAANTIGYRGFFYHFLDMTTAYRAWTSELSSIDSALLLAGILYAKEYFIADDTEEQEIRQLADSIYYRMDFNWMRNFEPSLTMGWHPESGFINARWIGYNEAMILYIMGLGSPTHPLAARSWDAWTSGYQWQTHYGYSFVIFPPLFGHQYSHCWIDFRNIADTYMRSRDSNYFENSRKATLANREYCIENPGGFAAYGENVWGITASDIQGGYLARGAPPALNDDGTIAPTAAGGSIPFAPEETIAALKYMYDTYKTDLWGPYGFKDAFNISKNWFASDHIGIDQGAIVLMIENYRTGKIWDVFMRNTDILHGLENAGFLPITGVTVPDNIPSVFSLEQNYPNPFNPSTRISYTIAKPGRVNLSVYNVLGQKISVLVDEFKTPGIYSIDFNADELPTGIYFYTLRADGFNVSQTMVLVR
jgi:hypothetical protein